MTSRVAAALCGSLAVAVFAGCYGSTEPATEVGPDSATLNARGTANNGPATAYFEYWVSGSSGPAQQTDPAHFPGGSSGPFSDEVTGLTPSTSYSFRVCGSDDSGGPTVCAQTRTFQTAAVEDSVTGDFDLGPVAQGTIDAHSGPSGEDPQGHVHYEGTYDNRREFDGEVTCVAVNGNQAAVGAVGEAIPLTGPPDPQPSTLLLTVVDSNGSGPDAIFGIFEYGSTPPNCATASFHNRFFLEEGELVVTDAPASGPTGAR